MKTYMKDFNEFSMNENSGMKRPLGNDWMKAEVIEDEFNELVKMLQRCVLQAEMINDMVYSLEEPGDVKSDVRDVGSKLKQVWAALTTGNPSDTSSLREIFK